MRKAIKVGLTGTSGAGKTVVAEELKKYGYAVVDADQIARLATEKGSPLLPRLAEVFGADVLNVDGTLDRKRLAEKAFANPEATALLNKTTHPEIVRLINKKIQGAFFDGYEAVIIDAPQLFESNLAYDCNFIISVVAPKEERLKRIMERDNLTAEEAERRVAVQKPDEFFKQNSDVYIENDGDLEKLKQYVLYTARLIEVKISGEGTLDF
ncbi:MAG: dephospho-CoA kinase [Clostridia bacterium]|nr:dephospho-CoA kinase [Clostridia bacterium]